MKDVKNKSVTVLGAARSGIAAAKLLKQKHAKVFVSDLASKDKKEPEMQILEEAKIDFEFGQHSSIVFDADFVVLSPGIPSYSPVVKNLISKKITTTLVGEMLRTEKPQSIVAGNIGTAFSEFVLASEESNWATVEVSSFQLETIDTFHPKIVIILNLAPNHLDWYDNYEDYIDAKLLILKNLQKNDYLIYNADDELLCEKVKDCPAKKRSFSLHDKTASIFLDRNKIVVKNKNLIETKQIRLNGNHNYQNAMAAILAVEIAGIRDENIISVLEEFKGVEHRLEYVADIEGITFINDSKATTIESLAVALSSFETPIILIAGGKDKGSDYSKLNNLIADNVRQVILIGSAKDKMSKTWQDIIPVHLSDTLAEAVEIAYKTAGNGENVLLSPACSSFDMFKDFEDRGKQFKEIVYKLKSKYEN
jgi:UDP-N-acetylmuramoylalanine--D-glutamate ligase